MVFTYWNRTVRSLRQLLLAATLPDAVTAVVVDETGFGETSTLTVPDTCFGAALPIALGATTKPMAIAQTAPALMILRIELHLP
jgi:hypothetical protein